MAYIYIKKRTEFYIGDIMNIVGFVGSPRKGGNSDILIRSVLEGAEDSGAKTKIFYLDDMDIQPCHACEKCAEGNGCASDDDMSLLYDEIDSADAIVVGSPIYYGQMSAQTKLFTDRFYAVSKDPEKTYEGKKAILTFTQGAPEGTYDDYIDLTIASPFSYVGFDVVGTIVASNLQEPGIVKEDEKIIETAKNMGSAIFD